MRAIDDATCTARPPQVMETLNHALEDLFDETVWPDNPLKFMVDRVAALRANLDAPYGGTQEP